VEIIIILRAFLRRWFRPRFRTGIAVLGLSLLGLVFLAFPRKTAGQGLPVYVWGRDTWLPAGSSRILRIQGNTDLIAAPGDVPTVGFSPGPVTVNYVQKAKARDLTVSITVPASTPPGPQSMQVSDVTLSISQVGALMIANGTIANP